MAGFLLAISGFVASASVIAFLVAIFMKKRTLASGSAVCFVLAFVASVFLMSAVLPGGIPAF